MSNEREREFIELLDKHIPSTANLKTISKDDPDRIEKFLSYQRGEKETKDIILALENAINYFGFGAKRLIEEIKQYPKAYDNLIQLSYEWVDFWYKKGKDYSDDRNAASTSLCKEMAESIIAHDGFVIESNEYAGLETAVLQMHRTLVQQATNMFAKVLYEENRSVKALLKSKYQSNDFKLPFI